MADHHVPTLTSIWLSLIVLLVCFDFSFAQGGKYSPVFQNVTALSNRFLLESLRVGESLGKILATDGDGTSITYSIEGAGGEYFSINPNSGELTLKKNLDYEYQNEIKSKLIAVDQDGQRSEIEVTCFVNDVNDNIPVFKDTAIFRSVPEDARSGYVVAQISVTDRDTVNAAISVVCDINNPSFTDACTTFNLVVTERTNTYWNGTLVLNKKLDYETKLSYNIRLIANDGDPTHNVSNEVHVEVIDVNDSPPYFAFAGPKNIDEEQPIGTFITQVNATDGDSTARRQINYELCGNNTDVFQINRTSGMISNAVRLDYDSTAHEKGVPYDVCIMAREVINNITGQLGNDATTTATLVIKVTILDINDNAPTFSQKTYIASVYENTVSGANIPGLQMTVTDIDSGTFNSFNLVTMNDIDVFGIVPAKDAGSSSATLFVRNGTKLDYEAGPRQYTIEVRAIQNFQNLYMWTGTATVIINVLDVNDITPAFDRDSYFRTVRETAPPGTPIIDFNAMDPEAGLYGTAGIIYKLYGDNVPPNFQIDEISGVVSVAPCSGTPGVSPCIDYERKQDYTLTVSATDNKGLSGSRTRSVQLFINVTDENDNIPKIDQNYVRYINENQMVTINPLLIEPSDPDTVGGPLIFDLRAEASGLWTITPMIDPTTGRQYGNITAKQPIKYRDAQYPSGEFNFVVAVADRAFTTTGFVKIIVIDINDNAPEFIPRQFLEYINETTKGDVFVKTITATDADAPTTGNGILDIYIQSGAQGKFTVTNVTLKGTVFIADIYTTKDATFNYETQNVYNMTLIARDRGSPESLFGTAGFTVYILDANNKNPSIKPSFQSVSVYENEPVGTTVYQVIATDPDFNSKLAYFMKTAQATDGSGDNVNQNAYDFTKLFRIEESTGNVVVNSLLDRDNASRITFNLTVVDITPTPYQTGLGTLLIHILEYNDKPPSFDLQNYNRTIDEGMNINSFVLNLNCRDPDDKIAGYALKQDSPLTPPTYFSLLPGSGAMIVNEPVDFEVCEIVQLTAQCTDAGQPSLSSTAHVTIYINNINDNVPIFSQTSYTFNVLENTVQGNPLNVTATDKDKGDFGVVRYMLNDPYGYFVIDELTGKITILPNATLDYEKAGFLRFLAIAYDSPLNESVRLSSAVPIYVTIIPLNDNCPAFTKSFYDVNVPESTRVSSIISEINFVDADDDSSVDVCSVKSEIGNQTGSASLFDVVAYKSYCRVSVRNSLKGKIGTYSLTITVKERDNSSGLNCLSETTIQIVVVQSDNNAPEWIRPLYRDTVIRVLESQYKGMVVYSSRAVDPDPGPNGVIDYYFDTNNGLVSNTSEFRINIVTGVISAEVVFDREQRDTYYLSLMAKDRGFPPSSSETTLTVVILDVDDNEPKFATINGFVIPKVLKPVSENVIIPQGGLLLDMCNATDADSDALNNQILYKLIDSGNAASDYIIVDNITCNIYLIKRINYETSPVLNFDILAYNPRNDDSVKRAKREANPSILPVSLSVQDSNDNPPAFVDYNYLACVSVDAPFQQNIVQVTALDKDVGDNSRITYSLSDTNAFQIDKNLGIISNIISFHEGSNGQTIYRFKAIATDGSNSDTTTVTIFVTSLSTVARLKVNRPVNDVLPLKQQLIKALVDSSNGDIRFACIDDVKSYVDENGQESATASNVLISAFKYKDNQYSAYSASDLVAYVDKERQQEGSVLNAIYVTDAKEEGKDDEFILKEDAVIAIFIICILLIFLAIVLLCICCICIKRSDRKKKKNMTSATHTVVHVKEEMEPSVNPVYNVGGSGFVDEAEYSTVHKVRPHGSPLHPVIVPAPYVTSEVDDVVPMEPPRAYLHDPDEPVIETYIDSEPVRSIHHAPEPVIETYLEPEPVIETYFDPEPVVERRLSPEPVHMSSRHFEPEFENRAYDVDDHHHHRPEVAHHVSFPEPAEEDEMDTSIRDSPPGSLPSSHRGSPPPLYSRHHVPTEYDSD